MLSALLIGKRLPILSQAVINTPDFKIVSVTTLLTKKRVGLYLDRTDKEWGLTDCISFAVMKE
jgi:predicted nucleic acid-binding protein